MAEAESGWLKCLISIDDVVTKSTLQTAGTSPINVHGAISRFEPKKFCISLTKLRPTSTTMIKHRFFLALGVLSAAVASATATTVIAPDFDSLVSQAEVIFQGTVSEVRSQWIGEGAERRIVSFVTFKVDDAIKGNPGPSYTLRMLGGTVDGRTLEVTDAPKFKTGDRDILFVEHNGSQFIPLVGIMHGRFQVKQDKTGREVLMTANGQPLVDVAQLGEHAQAPTTANGRAALSVNDFKAAIHTKIRETPTARVP